MNNKKMYMLEANGKWDVLIGLFSSKEKANKAWRRWKYAYKFTEWKSAKKKLYFYDVDTIFDKEIV